MCVHECGSSTQAYMHGDVNITRETMFVAGGHTASNAPDLFRTPKLSGAGPG